MTITIIHIINLQEEKLDDNPVDVIIKPLIESEFIISIAESNIEKTDENVIFSFALKSKFLNRKFHFIAICEPSKIDLIMEKLAKDLSLSFDLEPSLIEKLKYGIKYGFRDQILDSINLQLRQSNRNCKQNRAIKRIVIEDANLSEINLDVLAEEKAIENINLKFVPAQPPKSERSLNLSPAASPKTLKTNKPVVNKIEKRNSILSFFCPFDVSDSQDEQQLSIKSTLDSKRDTSNDTDTDTDSEDSVLSDYEQSSWADIFKGKNKQLPEDKLILTEYVPEGLRKK